MTVARIHGVKEVVEQTATIIVVGLENCDFLWPHDGIRHLQVEQFFAAVLLARCFSTVDAVHLRCCSLGDELGVLGPEVVEVSLIVSVAISVDAEGVVGRGLGAEWNVIQLCGLLDLIDCIGVALTADAGGSPAEVAVPQVLGHGNPIRRRRRSNVRVDCTAALCPASSRGWCQHNELHMVL